MSITFNRPLSPFIQSVFADAAVTGSRKYNTVLAIELTLQDSTVVRYATKAITMDSLSRDGASVDFGPLVFESRVSGAPDIRLTQGKAADSGDIEVVNLDYVLSSIIASDTRPFDNATITAYLAWRKPSGNYEGQLYYIGLVTGVTGDDETAPITTVSDLADRTSTLGAEIPQRCVNTFGDAWCAVTHIPDGGTCSLEWADAVNGCTFWGGVFNGVPFLTGSNVAPYTGGNGGGGWEPPYCPDLASWFVGADRQAIQGKDLGRGVVIFDHLGRPVTVEKAEAVYVHHRYRIVSEIGAGVICSTTHKLLRTITDSDGWRVSNWKHGQDGIVVSVQDQVIEVDNYKFHIAPPGWCLKLTTTAPHTYLAGMEPGKYVANHNDKYQGGIDPIIAY